jgi:hypothetical protein
MAVGDLDTTDAYIRVRQVEPSEFEKGSFRTIRLASGIKAIIGNKIGEKNTTIQSVLFDKKRFTEDKVRLWLKKHSAKFSDAINLEVQKNSLFANDDLEDHLDGHLPRLTQSQIARLMEVAGPADEEIQEPVDEDAVTEEYTSKFIKRI